MTKTKVFSFIILLIACPVFAQERIHDPIQEYFRALYLHGDIDRPYLTIQSNSRNKQDAPEQHLWSDYLSEGRSLGVGASSVSISLMPEQSGLSWNSAYAHGMNDGALWQGRGLNAWAMVGVVIETPYVSAILDMNADYSQNSDYDTVNDSYTYYRSRIDYPQRFGDDPLARFNLGESEVRFDWKTISIGFGREQLWLGPASENPIILGTNAAPFPKFDFGLKKSDTPLGPFEFIFWWGRLTESDYFDDVATNNHNLFSGTSIGWAPSFIPGLTVGINRIVIGAWENIDLSNLLTVLNPQFQNTEYGRDEEDQRASITMDWIFPSVGFNAYFEWARNDFSPNLRDNITLEPSHSQAYTVGLAQKIELEQGFIIVRAELSQLECSDSYYINLLYGYPGFYTHGIITQGHTNEGQILGAGIGTGSESQYLEAVWYHQRGSVKTFFRRISRDRDYLYQNPVPGDLLRLNVEVSVGLQANWFIHSGVMLSAGYELSNNINRNYVEENDIVNHYLSIGLRVN